MHSQGTWPVSWPSEFDVAAYNVPSLGPQCINFAERLLLARDPFTMAVAPIRLFAFQKWALCRLLELGDDGYLQYREAVYSTPRKNSKTFIASLILLYLLIFRAPKNAQLISIANDKEQASLVFKSAAALVASSPDLGDAIKLYNTPQRREIIAIESNATYRVMAAKDSSLVGTEPYASSVDEFAFARSASALSAIRTGSVALRESLALIVSTESDRQRNPMDALRSRYIDQLEALRLGLADPHPRFVMLSAEPPFNLNNDQVLADESAWIKANPAVAAGLIDVETLRESRKAESAETFLWSACNRRSNPVDAWIQLDALDACPTVDRLPAPDSVVVIGFDGSRSGDSTVLTATEVGGSEATFVLAAWERPENIRAHTLWAVDPDEVMDAIEAACAYWHVLEVAADPAMFWDELEAAAENGLPVVAVGNLTSVITKAAKRLYWSIARGSFLWDGSEVLRAHVANAKSAERGGHPVKRHEDDPIDALDATMLSTFRASWYAADPQRVADRLEDLGAVESDLDLMSFYD